MIDLEQIEHDITVAKSPNITHWLLPIDTIEQMLALIRKQEVALKESQELVYAQVRTIAGLTDENERLRNTIAGMQSRTGGLLVEKAEAAAPAAPVVTVDTPEFRKNLRMWRELQNGDDEGNFLRIVYYIDAHTTQAMAAKQAEIDRLMLEFFPDEMSAEQMATWEASQRRAPEAAPQQHAQAAQSEIHAALDRADAEDSRIHGNDAQAALSDVTALAWKWHDAAVTGGFAASEPAQELFELLGWPDKAGQQPAAAPNAPADLNGSDRERLNWCVRMLTGPAPLSAGEKISVRAAIKRVLEPSIVDVAAPSAPPFRRPVQPDLSAPSPVMQHAADTISGELRRAAASTPPQEAAARDERAVAWLHQLPPGSFFGDTEYSRSRQVLLTEDEAVMERESLGGTITPLCAALVAPAVQVAVPEGYAINRAEGHGWYIDPPKGGRWVAHDGTPAADLIAALVAPSPAQPAPGADGMTRIEMRAPGVYVALHPKIGGGHRWALHNSHSYLRALTDFEEELVERALNKQEPTA